MPKANAAKRVRKQVKVVKKNVYKSQRTSCPNKQLKKHRESVEAHRKKYERRLSESKTKGDTKRQQGAYKAKITESIGEEAAANLMQKNYPDYEMVRGFEAGTGYDQVYVKRNPNGEVTDIMIVEAKGPNAKLGKTKNKGPQMSKEWVEKTASEMQRAKNPETSQLGKKLADAIDNGPPPKVKGKVIQATEGGGAKEIDCPNGGIYN